MWTSGDSLSRWRIKKGLGTFLMSLKRTAITGNQVTTHASTTAAHSKKHFFLNKKELYISLQTIKSSPKVSLMQKFHKKLQLIEENSCNWIKPKNCFPIFGLGFLQPARKQFDAGSCFKNHGIQVKSIRIKSFQNYISSLYIVHVHKKGKLHGSSHYIMLGFLFVP